MLIIEVKDGESIDRALRRYRRKHQRTQLKQEIMRRKHYTKPSTRRRTELLKAIYRDKMDASDL
jgi:small subunit ribosomal protein S21